MGEQVRRLRKLDPANDGTTHWSTCWQDHDLCAIAKVDGLIAERDRLAVENSEMREGLEGRLVYLAEHEVRCHGCSATTPLSQDLKSAPLVHRWPCFLAQPADARGAELMAAAEAMAEDLSTLLAGGIELKPAPDGPVTFEAMLMMLQMMALHRDHYCELVGGGREDTERW